MLIRVSDFRRLIREELNEASRLKKAVASAAMATALGMGTPASAQQQSYTAGPHPNSRVEPSDISVIVKKASKKYNVPEKLIHAIISTESSYRPYVTSGCGAGGLMQLMPATAKWLGVHDVYDIEQNIMGGSKYLSYLLKRFNDIEHAIAAYNAGPGNVAKHGGVPPFPETQKYVKSVMQRMGK